MSEFQGDTSVAPAPVPGTAPAAAAPAAAFPRVNLLPPQIAQEGRVRRARLVLVGATAVSVVLVGGLFVMAQNDVDSAQQSLDVANAQAAQLATQVATYSDVPRVFAELNAAEGQLATAMGREVRWSYLLNDLALTIPKNVALVGFTGQLSQPEPAVPQPQPTNADGSPATTPAAGTTPAVEGPIGTITYNGEATGYKAIASWLDSQGKQRTFDQVYLSSATRAESEGEDGPTVIEFSSTSDLTSKALSHRFDRTGK